MMKETGGRKSRWTVPLSLKTLTRSSSSPGFFLVFTIFLFVYVPSANFVCEFLLDVYPFDVQQCQIRLALNEKQLDTVR